MPIKDTRVIIKEDGGSSSTLKKKKKKEEEKAVAVIKDGGSPSLAGGVARATGDVANRDSAKNGNRSPSYAESRQPTPTVLSNSTSPKMATTERREFTYDDYINAVASEKAMGMLNRYFKTGEVPSNLPSTLKQRISGNTASRLREGDHEVVEGVANRAASNTGNTSPISTKPDYSSPTAAWRNPETFQAIPWSDYEGLNKYDRRAYLKAYAENSQREKAQRDAIAQAEAQRLNQEKSDKMLADHFYSRMLKGEQIDVSNFDTKTLQNLQQRAYEDYSSGNLSMEKYLLMPIHKFESLDNGQAKVYNGNIDNPTQPLMQTSGFDRYRTERYDYVPANYVGNKKPSSGNAGKGNNIDTIDDIRHIEELAKEHNLSTEHARIVYYSSKWEGHKDVKWTTADIALWQTFGKQDFLFSQKKKFVSNYKDVIADAAAKYDIPVFLLAGIAHTEYGGDPMWLDDLAYTARNVLLSGPDWLDDKLSDVKDPIKTSFGNTSIQVRRALEMLNYDDTSANKRMVIDSLKDPIQNIYMAAKHLDVLRNVDFYGKSASELTDEEIQIIASRYNVGPECSIEIAAEADYGKSIFKNKDRILEALS